MRIDPLPDGAVFLPAGEGLGDHPDPALEQLLDAFLEARIQRRHLLRHVIERAAAEGFPRLGIGLHFIDDVLQRLDRVLALDHALGPALADKAADDFVQHRVAERLLTLKMMVKGALFQAGARQHIVYAHALKTVLEDLLEGRVEQGRARLVRIACRRHGHCPLPAPGRSLRNPCQEPFPGVGIFSCPQV